MTANKVDTGRTDRNTYDTSDMRLEVCTEPDCSALAHALQAWDPTVRPLHEHEPAILTGDDGIRFWRADEDDEWRVTVHAVDALGLAQLDRLRADLDAAARTVSDLNARQSSTSPAGGPALAVTDLPDPVEGACGTRGATVDPWDFGFEPDIARELLDRPEGTTPERPSYTDLVPLTLHPCTTRGCQFRGAGHWTEELDGHDVVHTAKVFTGSHWEITIQREEGSEWVVLAMMTDYAPITVPSAMSFSALLRASHRAVSALNGAV